MAQNNSTDEVELRKEYYDLGTLWTETPYVNGKRHGLRKVYYEAGALWSEIPYVNGLRHGLARGYDSDNTNIDCLTLYKGNRQVLVLCLESYR